MLHLPLCLQEEVLRHLDLDSIRIWASCCRATHALVADAMRRAAQHLCVCESTSEPNWFACVFIKARRRACATFSSQVDTLQLLHSSDAPIVRSSEHHLPTESAHGYWVVIDSVCQRRLMECLAAVVARYPQYIFITCDSEHQAHTLQDRHVALLSAVPTVAIPGHKALTDVSLDHMSRCQAVWLAGCSGLTGGNLPRCVARHNALMSIKWIGGWGAQHPFSNATRAWLRKQEAAGLIINQW
jgi:hypothetical protein